MAKIKKKVIQTNKKEPIITKKVSTLEFKAKPFVIKVKRLKPSGKSNKLSSDASGSLESSEAAEKVAPSSTKRNLRSKKVENNNELENQEKGTLKNGRRPPLKELEGFSECMDKEKGPEADVVAPSSTKRNFGTKKVENKNKLENQEKGALKNGRRPPLKELERISECTDKEKAPEAALETQAKGNQKRPEEITIDKSSLSYNPLVVLERLPVVDLEKSPQSSPKPIGTPHISPKLNLAKKSDLIEQMFLSDEEEETQKVKKQEKHVDENKKPPRKFVHTNRRSNSAKKRTRRNENDKKDEVYDFLSQSQSSSDANDPAADVIQKLIDEGKVSVATHKIGSGTLRVKPVRRKRPTKTQKAIAGMVPTKEQPKKPAVEPKVSKRVSGVATQVVDDNHDYGDPPAALNESFEKVSDGFSQLARSAIMNSVEKSRKDRQMVYDRRKLMEVARKFVGQSTPVNQKKAPNVSAFLSPIQKCPSPFRVDESLPQLFNFSRNSQNLPSYSSDIIPASPKKQKKANISSILNDSNAENVAPKEKQLQANTTRLERSKLPLGTRPHRSPLKEINVVEVLNLPALSTTEMSKLVNGKKDNEPVKDTNEPVKDTNEPVNQSDPFGFDEIVQEDEENVENSKVNPLPSKKKLKTKLKDLKRFLPPSQPTRFSFAPVRDIIGRPVTRQANIKQMLCSTMIDQPRKSSVAPNFDNSDSDMEDFEEDRNSRIVKNLFEEPETSFDANNPRRTYTKRNKRTRKLRHHNFVMFMDSDESASEAEDKSPEKPKARTKRQKRDELNSDELEKFANEFNSMCDEIDKTELVVE